MKRKEPRRAVLLVIDSLGIGELPDAAEYGDQGSNTLENTSRAAGGLHIPNLEALGLGLIKGVRCVEAPAGRPLASYGRMQELSHGKDTSTGHWEMAGVVVETPSPTFPQGFPQGIMERFTRETGYDYLWARPASGVEIIKRFGKEHLETGKLIVYTSADSVFQIAAHTGVVPLDELYRVCTVTRGFLDEYNITRVIARPFIGRPGEFTRTADRKDFSTPPPGQTLLDRLYENGTPVVGIGKIGDIFAHRSFTEEIHTAGNRDVFDKTADAMVKYPEGLIFANLVDFDMLYGHCNDPVGYARALEYADGRLPQIMDLLNDGELLVITADHGCDPTTAGTDHSREYVPLLVLRKTAAPLVGGAALGTRGSFADLGQTLAGYFGAGPLERGESFLAELLA